MTTSKGERELFLDVRSLLLARGGVPEAVDRATSRLRQGYYGVAVFGVPALLYMAVSLQTPGVQMDERGLLVSSGRNETYLALIAFGLVATFVGVVWLTFFGGRAQLQGARRVLDEWEQWESTRDAERQPTAHDLDTVLARAAHLGGDSGVSVLQLALEPALRGREQISGDLVIAAVEIYAAAAVRTVYGSAACSDELDEATRKLSRAAGAAAR